MRIGWLLLCLVLTVLQARLGVRRLATEQRKVQARESLQRLTNITLQLYRGGHPPKPDTFWSEVGMGDPLLDPWGTAYQMQNPRPQLFQWRSAGPDLLFLTSDDLFTPVSSAAAVIPDLAETPSDFPGPTTVMDAR